MKKYAGLIHEVGIIKDHVDRERQKARLEQESLKAKLRDREKEALAVQKELSIQLRCAGRSYQQLLNATRELQEQLEAEKTNREKDKLPYIDEIRALKAQLSKGDKPWRDEISKRDAKILKLQEAASHQEVRLREAVEAIEPVRVEGEKKLKAAEERAKSIQKEVFHLQEEVEEIKEKWQEEVSKAKEDHHKEVLKLQIKIREIEAESDKIAGPYIKQIKELELQKQGLEVQLSQVDYTPFEKQVEIKEKGYDLLVHDFRTKEQTHSDNVDRMREGFEEVIQKLDRKLQSLEKEYEKKMEPWVALVAEREEDVRRLQDKIKTMQEEKAEAREQVSDRQQELEEELKATKEGLDLFVKENTKLRRQRDEIVEQEAAPTHPKQKMQAMEMRLDEVTRRCEILIKNRDRELKEKTEIISKLQDRVLQQSKENMALDRKWDDRVQLKEEGYGIVVAQLKHAEGQILEEREKTAAAKREIQKRDQRILDLKQEHSEELRCRLRDRNMLFKRNRELEAEMATKANNEDEIRREWEAAYDDLRTHYECREADLEIEIVRRDKAQAAREKELLAVRGQFDKARITWESKERELEVLVRTRDRLVTSLKNEIELVAESWEVKYDKLLSLFDKLQKKYDELLGPGGLSEALRRARDLKEENVQLTRQTHELKEMIKKQKRQIRDLQLDIDMHMKETADLILQKEQGIAEMVGDYAKLQAQFRNEVEQKERITIEMTEEKRAIVASFQARIEQLEQLVEAMRFTDREELVDTIDVWKRAYARICIARDEMEEEYQAQLFTKDKQLRKMALDNSEERENVQKEIAKWLEKVQQVEEEWKKKMVPLHIQKEELEKKILELERNLLIKEAELRRALRLADSRLEDPEKEAMKKKIAELEANIKKQEEGVRILIEENTQLRQHVHEVVEQAEGAQEDWEPQIRWRDERYEAMMKEHEQVKQILQQEMLKAQEACKQIEEQVRRFPNPFEAELEELKDRYAQMQAGTQRLSVENVQLREKLQDQEEAYDEEKRLMEDQIRVAHHILQQVTGLGALRHLGEEASTAAKQLGIDPDKSKAK
eukprot:CAMPEP_0181424488 /NCGR_PEP_ID=MMETSP1110-20121109/14672_1 /TAXON_ID=174948 /ORGANISM="Symbiodinium sp., Strain CCMP421" /LENGTH=1062 /DNA_ID=CAMNT_0023547651 /DNA_START=106 /DNA_END=3294 /DNA_ORIENTATION=-